MSLEEIKAYNSLLSKAANIQDVFSIIDGIDNELDLVLIAKSLLNDISILEMKIDINNDGSGPSGDFRITRHIELNFWRTCLLNAAGLLLAWLCSPLLPVMPGR